MVCMETLVKDMSLMILESATPPVDQPARWVNGREVDKGVVVHFPQWLSPQLHGCYLLFNQATNIALQEMRTLHNDLQYIQ